MKLSQFKFKLPEEQVALEPPHRVFENEDGTVTYETDQTIDEKIDRLTEREISIGASEKKLQQEEQADLFTDQEAQRKERSLQNAMLSSRSAYQALCAAM